MADTTTHLLRLPQVRDRTGLSRSTIYLRMRAGTFPAPRALGGRCVAWRADDIAAWIESRPSARPTPDAAP